MDNVKFVVGKTYLCVLQMNMQRANELVQVPRVGAENEAGPPQVAAVVVNATRLSSAIPPWRSPRWLGADL